VRNKGAKKLILPGWLFCFTLTAVFSVLGLGYAVWRDQLAINVTASTGKIDPVVTRCWLDNHSKTPDGLKNPTFRIDWDEKTISILIEDAYPGYNALFAYEIVNRGSLPLRLQSLFPEPEILLEPGAIVLGNTLTPEVLKSGETATGCIQITIQDVAEPGRCSFSFSLDFVQL